MKEPSRAKPAPTKKHVILFLAANPRDTCRLALDKEAHAIHVELKRTGDRERFEFVTRWAVEPLDLLREVRELRPTIVHFSGHGASSTAIATEHSTDGEPVSDSAGLVVSGANGRSQVVAPEAFAQMLGSVSAPVCLVVLNACYTAPAADALLAHVDCVVGMTGAISDHAARSFAVGFYGGLGEHESIAAAFAQGQAAVRLDGLADADRPQLHVRAGADAAQIIPAAFVSVFMTQPCPYPGMRPFAADDEARFHGRDVEIQKLVELVRAGTREVFVIGPSGSGKSSLVMAGVLPRLARGLSGRGPFVVRQLRPGEQPATQLAQVLGLSNEPVAAGQVAELLAPHVPNASLLIVIDQLEELFTHARADERDRFAAALRALWTEDRCQVIFTLRADFYGALMDSTLWSERGGELSRLEVGPLRGEALHQAISTPAESVGATVQPELIAQLLADAASAPGIMPLLQVTLVELWDAARERGSDEMLTLADYQAIGDGKRSGLAVALANRADATLQQLTAAQTKIARRILLRLVSFGEGRSDTRRQQPRAQLRASGDDEADFDVVLQTMVDNRLLTVDEDISREPQVDLAHEIMISEWPKLAAWIRNHRADEQRRRRLEATAAEWAEHGRGARGLLDPIELADAEQWQHTESAVQLGHSTDVIALIAASRAAHTKQRRRRRAIGSAAGSLGLVAVAVAAAFLTARDEAENARRAEADERRAKAEAQGLAADNGRLAATNRQLIGQSHAEVGRRFVVGRRFEEAIPHLLAARRYGMDGAPLRMMFWEAERHLPLTSLVHQSFVTSAAFSSDGTRVVTASMDWSARVWDAATGRPVTVPLKHKDAVHSAKFSPNGARVVTASYDHTALVWDATSGQVVTPPLMHQDNVTSAAFSPDGTRVVTASEDHTARVWNATTGQAITLPLMHQDKVRIATFSPDGTRVVTASEDHTARIWDAATGMPIIPPLTHHGAVYSAAFSLDGTRVVTASQDQTAQMWSVATGKPLLPPLKHQGYVESATFSPDGTRVVTHRMPEGPDRVRRTPVLGAHRARLVHEHVWRAGQGARLHAAPGARTTNQATRVSSDSRRDRHSRDRHMMSSRIDELP